MFLKKWLDELDAFDRAYHKNRIQSELFKKDEAKFYWTIAQRSTSSNATLLKSAQEYIAAQESTNPNWKQWCREWQQCSREIV